GQMSRMSALSQAFRTNRNYQEGEAEMRLAEAYAGVDLSKIKEALIGGRLIVYSTGCPHSADHAIAHGAELASFAFASPTFGPDAEDGTLAPLFSDNPVIAKAVGTP